MILPLPRRPCSSLPCRSFLRAAPPLPFSPPPPLPSVTAVPPYRRSYSAAPAVPFVPPSDALLAVCCRRAARPPTLTVPRRLYTHTPDLLLDRVCVEERTEPPVCPAAASLGQKMPASEVDASMSAMSRSALAFRR